MSRLLTTLLAGAAALAFAGTAIAADQDKDPQRRDNQTQAQPNATQGKPEQSDAQAARDTADPGGSSQPQSNTTGKPEQDEAEATGAGGTSSSQAAGQSNDPVQRNQTKNQARQAGADEGNMGRKPDQPGGKVSAEEQEYLTDLEKCDSMTGASKRTCVNAAKKKHGQM
jgi:hypothetical protein